MHTQDFAELAGRVEGVARALMITIATLEQQRAIDGPALSAALRRSLASAPAGLATAARTLGEIALALDEARASRAAAGRG